MVVLGSGLVGGDQVPPLLAGRIAAGLTAYAERGAGVMIMSGGRGPDEKIAEAVAMAGWARENGADAERLLVEDRSHTTEENLRFTAELLSENRPPMPSRYPGEQRPVRVPGWLDQVFGEPIAPDPSEGLIVTSDYHALRAAVLARRIGLPAQATGARTARYYWPSAMLREYVALLVERWPWHVIAGVLIAVPVPLLVLTASSLR